MEIMEQNVMTLNMQPQMQILLQVSAHKRGIDVQTPLEKVLHKQKKLKTWHHK